MRKQQDVADKEDENKTTLTHIVHVTTIYKTWDINYNINEGFVLRKEKIYSLFKVEREEMYELIDK